MIMLFFAFYARCSRLPDTWTCVLMYLLICSLWGLELMHCIMIPKKITALHLIAHDLFQVVFTFGLFYIDTRTQSNTRHR